MIGALSRRVLLAIAAVMAVFTGTVDAHAAPPSPGNRDVLTVEAQTVNWTASQKDFYRAKVARRDAERKHLLATGVVRPFGCVPTPCVPDSRLLGNPIYQEPGGVNGCWCGPATVRMDLWNYIPEPQLPSQDAIAAYAGTTCGPSGSGTSRAAMQSSLNNWQSTNPYIWSNISYDPNQGPVDLMADTSVDIGGYGFSLAYNVLTYSPPEAIYWNPPEGGHGGPLWRWGTIRAFHYMSGVGYNQSGSTVTVNDPAWATQDAYSAAALWAAIDNHPAQDQVLW